MNHRFIDTDHELAAFCKSLQGAEVIALDTEFLREKTYYAQLCLIQVAAADVIACVDPLSIGDLSPFIDIIYDPAVIKVMHSGRQDLEIFFDLTGRLPQPLFDTQLAATLLGDGDQVGYAALVEKILGVKLDKSHTRTDWSRRPLDPGQIDYAMDDVRHLLAIYDEQQRRLQAAGRLAWLAADFAQLTDVNTYAPQESDLWQKVRGAKNLKGVQLVVLQNLTRWRENLAREQNRPRRWLVRDDVLLEVARRMPVDEEALNRIHGWENGLHRFNATVLQLIQEAKASDPNTWPKKIRYLKLTLEQDALVDLLMCVVRLRALENQVTPSMLATRKDLESLVCGHETPLLCGWRKALLGDELSAILQGEFQVCVRQGKLSVTALSP
ncbi:MAG: ribonuclease D [Gammaproteobacteria bacterium]|nr:ribonuclease D [Gammaproteobacteria bacterium]MDH5802435.1 ribonuclease D [Gammaproteobacteria bacterium]